MTGFAFTIFLSAFLLFQVQPLIGRFILPWFGGSPAVWTTCLLFFQIALLGGYLYSHVLVRAVTVRTQTLIHTGVLLLSLAALPILPDPRLRPTGQEDPVMQILIVLSVTIGLPYFSTSTTGPLLQSWFSVTFPSVSPWRLFALSNLGSLVALISYPFVFEPRLSQTTQALWWSAAYVVFGLTAAATGIQVRRRLSRNHSLQGNPVMGERVAGELATGESDPGISRRAAASGSFGTLVQRSCWVLLSLFPSVLLMATTNQICQEVAVVPFLWILPLALYLITFIVSFDRPQYYVRFLAVPLMLAFVGGAVHCLSQGLSMSLWMQVAILCGAMFFCCLCCHGELSRNRPESAQLTLFYLLVSVGGALGGVFSVLVAPRIFRGYWELHVGLLACSILASAGWLVAAETPFTMFLRRIVMRGCPRIPARCVEAGTGPIPRRFLLCAALATTLSSLAHQLWQQAGETPTSVIHQRRDFYGILTVHELGVPSPSDDPSPSGTDSDSGTDSGSGTDSDADGTASGYRALKNGRIMHGSQFLDKERQLVPTSYYCRGSGIDLAIRYAHPRRTGRTPLHIGVVGLGTGSIAGWGRVGDRIRFYEINPAVLEIATTFFTYVTRTPATVSYAIGDARVQMEREFRDGGSQQFDVLAIDAFSSDAIPRHLITKECFELYFRHLKPGGILAVHVSNRFIDLQPIAHTLAVELEYAALRIDFDHKSEDAGPLSAASTWVLLTRDEGFFQAPVIQSAASPWPQMPHLLWTDDFGSLWQVIRLR